MRFTACTFVFAALLAVGTFAQQRDKPSKQSDVVIDPQFKADIKRMIDISHLQDRTKELSRLRFEQLRPQLIASLPPIPNRDKIVDEYSEKYVKLFLSDDYMNQMVATSQLGDIMLRNSLKSPQTECRLRIVYPEGGTPNIWKELCTEYPELQGQTKFCPQPESEKKGLLTEPALGAPGESIHEITGK